MADLFDLTGKVALVTGGSRGLGREMVLGFARAGADVVIASRKFDACQAVASEVEAIGRRALPYGCHIGRWDQIDGLIEAAYAAFGRVDILVNNAGMSPQMPSLEMTDDFFDKIVAVNLKGPFRLSAVIGARMAQGDGGAIINISSGASLRPVVTSGPYSAAKAGLNALTQVFAQEYGPKVRANTIVCGAFRTDMYQPMGGARPEHRAAEPDEIVTTALYLASPASSFTSGAEIRVDGGPR